MCRTLAVGLSVFLSWVALSDSLQAQINPAGFQDPLGASRAGTGNPPNLSIGPIGGNSTLPPGAPAYPREVETNPALRQEVRRPFGASMYPRGQVNRPDSSDEDGGAVGDPAKKLNFTERQAPEHVEGHKSGRAGGKLATDWRYSYYQGRHWYWMPDKTWAVWNGSTWIRHVAGMFSRPIFGAGTTPRRFAQVPAGYNGRDFGQPEGPPDDLMQVATAATRSGGSRMGVATSASKTTAAKPVIVESDVAAGNTSSP